MRPQAPEQTVRIVVAGPETSDTGPTARGGSFAGLRPVFEIAARFLPGLTLIIAIVAFRGEISDYLRHTSKVEIFGIKLEKAEFDRRLEEARKKGPDIGTAREPWWGEVAFRKLRFAASFLAGLKVLWVDDNPQNNFELRRILGDFGVRVTIALHNAEALELIRREDFDIVISDFGRDKEEPDGGDLARELRDGKITAGESRTNPVQYAVPILFYTSNPKRVPDDVPRDDATNDPAQLLSDVAELAFTRRT
jgi:CheY-like chemotaxis protein